MAWRKFEENLAPTFYQIKGLKFLIEHFTTLQKSAENEFALVNNLITGTAQDSKTVLTTFDSRLVLMKETILHESLLDSTHKTLMDCIDEPKAKENFSAFKVLSEELKVVMDKSFELQKLLGEKPSATEANAQWFIFQNVKDKLRTAVQNCKLFSEIAEQSLHRATGEIERAKKVQRENGIRTDVSECLEELFLKSKEHLEQMEQFEKEMNAQMLNLLKMKFTTITKISSIFETRKKLKEFLNSVPQTQTKVVEHSKILQNLQSLLQFPKLYAAYIEEMQRRAAFQKVVSKKASLANDLFQRLAKEETEKRTTFKNKTGTSLSSLFAFPGISSTDSLVKVDILIPQDNLLKFNESHIDISKADEDDFTVLMSDSFEATELRKENEKLRAELEEKPKPENIDVAAILHSKIVLEEKLAANKEEHLRFFEEYESRFQTMKKQLEEMTSLQQRLQTAETKLQVAETKLTTAQKVIESPKKNDHYEKALIIVNQQLASVSSALEVETNKRIQIEKQLALALSDKTELDELKNKRTVSDNNFTTVTKRLLIAEQDNQNFRQALAQNTLSISQLQEHVKEYKKQLRALSSKSMSECPVCDRLILEEQLTAHVYEKHPELS